MEDFYYARELFLIERESASPKGALFLPNAQQ
jgi:hypothetical protein